MATKTRSMFDPTQFDPMLAENPTWTLAIESEDERDAIYAAAMACDEITPLTGLLISAADKKSPAVELTKAEMNSVHAMLGLLERNRSGHAKHASELMTKIDKLWRAKPTGVRKPETEVVTDNKPKQRGLFE